MNCPPLLAPEAQVCSGRGVCLSSTECLCQDGWTGAGDFVYGAPGCNLNIVVVKVMWSLCAIAHLIEVFLVWRFVRVKLQVKKSVRRRKPFLMAGLLLGCNLSFATVGIIRAANVDTRTIGTDVALTIVFCVGATFYWAMIHVFVLTFIDIVHRQAMIFQRRTTWIIHMRHLRIAVGTIGCFACILCLVPLGMLGSSDPQVFFILAAIHYVGLGCCILVSGIVLVPMFSRKLELQILNGKAAVIDGVNGNLSVAFNRLLSKLRWLNQMLFRQALPQFSLALIIGVWPFLQVHGSSYFLPFAWTSGAFLGSLAMYLHLPIHGLPSTQMALMVSSEPANNNDIAIKTNLLSRLKSNVSMMNGL